MKSSRCYSSVVKEDLLPASPCRKAEFHGFRWESWWVSVFRMGWRCYIGIKNKYKYLYLFFLHVWQKKPKNYRTGTNYISSFNQKMTLVHISLDADVRGSVCSRGRGGDAEGRGLSRSFYIWIQDVRAEKDVEKVEEKGVGGKRKIKVRRRGGKSLHLYVSTREKWQMHKANEQERKGYGYY